MKILYEDNHLLVIEKPINVPVQRDATGDEDLLNLCKQWVKQRYSKPGEVYLGMVHRLDRPVGGVMVFARTSKAATRLTEQFKAHRAKKRYIAIVEGNPKSADTLEDWLLKDEKSHSSAVVNEGTTGAKNARLSYRTLYRDNGRAILDIELFTGRPHQIRVQLSNAGLPIVGDQRYNKRAQSGVQIRLWAYALSIEHPTTKECMTFYSIPNWQEFAVQLKLLPAFNVCSGVYEDDDMLIVDKNRSVEVTEGLIGELGAFYEQLYPVHRLDANTEGLVVLAKNLASKDRLEDIFYRHEAKKLYHAIVIGRPNNTEGRLIDWARKDGEGMRLCSKNDPDAQRMELSYRVLQSKNGLSKLEIRLYTGRTHQIRLQLSGLGCPILGDDRYGSREQNRQRKRRYQQLLAKRLTIEGKTFVSCKELEL